MCVVEDAGRGGATGYLYVFLRSLYDFFVLIMMHINHAKCNSAFTQDQDTYVASAVTRVAVSGQGSGHRGLPGDWPGSDLIE